MSFPYPDKPWEDGQQAYYYNADGTVTIGTYNAAEDRWEMEVISINTDNEFIDTQHVLVINPVQNSLQEAKVFSAPYADPLPSITTQYDANQALLQETILSAKNTARVGDLLDFTQNTAVQGYWVHTQDEGGNDVPSEAEFFAFDEDGNNTTEFADFRLIKFNDNGVVANPGTENVLVTARVGDQLVMQELGQNHFGQYIITSITTYNTDGVIYREFGVKVYKQGQRAFGDCDYLAHCAVRVMRPEVVIVQDDQPVVSSRGVLWYREADDHLFISNYADGFTGIGPQWTDLTAGGGGDSSVHVGELPPAEEEGALWFDTTRLELYVYYVEGEDGGWLPSSPLGARVSAGEALQAEINTRLASVETDFVSKSKNSTITDAYLRFDKVTKADTALVFDFKRAEDGNSNKSVRFIDFKDDDQRMMDIQSTAAGYTQIQLENDFKQFKIVGKIDGNLGQLVKVYTNGKVGVFNLRYPTGDHDAASVKFVRDEISASNGGPTSKYDSNFFSRSGVSGTTLNQGDVMFMNDQLVSTTDPHEIGAIAFCPFDFDWDKCAYSGIIRARSGSRNAGFYQVYDYNLMENRMMILYVKQVQVEDGVTLGYDSGCPCRFQGVFFE